MTVHPHHRETLQAWQDEGFFARPALLDGLARAARINCADLRANFSHVCSPNRTLTQAGLGAWIAAHMAADPRPRPTNTPLPAAIDAVVPLLFRSLHRLSTYPFPPGEPVEEAAAAGISHDGLLRAMAFALPVGHRMCTFGGARGRSPADHRRALFVSLAEPVPGNVLPFDEARWRGDAARRAVDFPADVVEGCGGDVKGYIEDFIPVNRDDGGDEIYYDMVERLFMAQKPVDLGVARIPWEAFKDVAKELVAGSPRLNDYVIGGDELKVLVEGMLALQGFMPYPEQRILLSEVDGEVVDALLDAFNVGGVEGRVKWVNLEMFDPVLAKVAPALLDPFRYLLEAFTKPFPVPEETTDPQPESTLESRPAGGILSLSRLAQIRTVTHGGVGGALEDLLLEFEWDRAAAAAADTTTSTLTEAMRVANRVILLVRGTASGKSFIFGFHAYNPLLDEAGIQNNQPYSDEVLAALFQLAPVQDGFPGVIGQPAWEMEDDDGRARFGSAEAGASLEIDLKTGQAIFARKVGVDEGVYKASTCKGSWEVELDLDKVEVWRETRSSTWFNEVQG